jgi:hypothetical protein
MNFISEFSKSNRLAMTLLSFPDNIQQKFLELFDLAYDKTSSGQQRGNAIIAWYRNLDDDTKAYVKSFSKAALRNDDTCCPYCGLAYDDCSQPPCEHCEPDVEDSWEDDTGCPYYDADPRSIQWYRRNRYN